MLNFIVSYFQNIVHLISTFRTFLRLKFVKYLEMRDQKSGTVCSIFSSQDIIANLGDRSDLMGDALVALTR